MPRGKNKALEGSSSSASLNEKKENEVEEEMVNSTIDVISVNIGSPAKDVDPYHNCVKFKVNYSDSYKGVKYYKKNQVLNISKESAEIFEKAGVGKLL